MTNEEFIDYVSKLNISITDEIMTNLDKYYNLLITENQKYNLTAITEKKEVYLKHFYDSLTLTKTIKLSNQKIIDLGTGAGFPGIVLKIFYPDLKITLLDSTSKKCAFLQMITEKLNLKDVTIINERAEIYSKKVREEYDLVVSRAVAPLKHLLEYGIPLLKIGGKFISMKANIEKEIIDIEDYINKLNLINLEVLNFELPIENSNRNLVVFEKNKKTNSTYPRKYSEIKREKM